MYLKKIFDGEIIFHLKKETEKIVLLQVKGLIQIIVKFRTEKIFLHVSLSLPRNIILRGIDILWTNNHCVAILSKGTSWKFMVPCRKVNWHVLQTAKTHLRYSNWFMISEKKYYLRQFEVHVSSPWLCMQVPKSLCKQAIQKKLCTRISNFFSP